MIRAIRLLKWPLVFAYALAGALALMICTPAGVQMLGGSALSFIPAKILIAPWSLLLLVLDDGPVTALAVLGIGYGLNVGVALMLAREAE